MAMRVLLLTLIVAIFAANVRAFSVSEKPSKILVVVDDASVEETHSKLFEYLRERNYQLDVRAAKGGDFALKKGGEYIYDGVALLCPKASGMDERLPISALIEFLDDGRDVFVAASNGFSDYTRAAARMVGVDLADSSMIVVDHVRHAGDHGWIYAGGRTGSWRLFGDTTVKLGFRGPAATLFTDNELVDSVVWGSGSTYAAVSSDEPLRKPTRAIGSQIVLGAVLSSRARSRGAYWGSLDALGDAACEAFGHDDALYRFVAWTFGFNGVLAVANTRHYRLDNDGTERGYRVKDRLSFEMDVLEWYGDERRWRPFVGDDVQLEFTMLNPWVRTRFDSAKNGTLRAVVQVPDQIGVYKFVVSHHRPGLSPIVLREVVPIRPFLHNEYERFILQATPYYATCFSMLAGVFLLGLVVLLGDDSEAKKRTSSESQSGRSSAKPSRKPKNKRS